MKTTLKSTLKALLTLTFILTLLLNGTAFAQSAFDQTAAENLALEAAGATRERALLFPTEIETEHGQTAYDVEFRCDGFEYEYWISTTDGAIIKRAWGADEPEDAGNGRLSGRGRHRDRRAAGAG